MPLASEAIRGEGAILINARGKRFMEGIPGKELAPRDVVARAIWQETAAGNDVYLDARAMGEDFLTRFPSVTALCRRAGLDPVTQTIPPRLPGALHAASAFAQFFARRRANAYGAISVETFIVRGA